MSSQGFSPVFFHKVHLCGAAFQGIMLILAVIHNRPKAAIWSAIFFAFALLCCRYYRSKIDNR